MLDPCNGDRDECTGGVRPGLVLDSSRLHVWILHDIRVVPVWCRCDTLGLTKMILV